jgi:hypothetical protein
MLKAAKQIEAGGKELQDRAAFFGKTQPSFWRSLTERAV